MRVLVPGGLSLLAAACSQPAVAPPGTPDPPPLATSERSAQPVRRADSFIASYSASLAGETAQLRAAGLGQDWDAIRVLVEAHLPSQDYPLGATGATPAIMRRLHVDATTNRLVRAGYRIRHLSSPQQARSLVSAAADLFGDADALVLFAPIVLVADLDRIETKPDNSTYLVYRVSEAIKSAPPIGSEFRLMRDPPHPTIVPKAGDPPPPPPPPNPAIWELASSKRAVFFLQPAETLIPPRVTQPTGEPATLFAPMPVGDGERVMPGYHSGTQPTTLSAIRAAARAQLCSPGYSPVAQGVDLPHRC